MFDCRTPLFFIQLVVIRQMTGLRNGSLEGYWSSRAEQSKRPERDRLIAIKWNDRTDVLIVVEIFLSEE